jgi:hypothetical protein
VGILLGQSAGVGSFHFQTLAEHVGEGDGTCEGSPTEAACGAASPDCRWCVCHAVPSVCVTQEEAARLPPSVFSCAPPKPLVATE